MSRMTYLGKRSDHIVILKLGKSKKPLSKYDLTRYDPPNERICHITLVPADETIRKSVDNLLSKGYLNEIIVERGSMKLSRYTLSDRGKIYYDDLVDIFPIVELLPDFETYIRCNGCSDKEKIQCFEERKIDLINTIYRYNYTETREMAIIIANKILDLFETPNQLEEYIFWLIMSKLSIKRLNKKYKKPYEKTLIGARGRIQ